MEKIRTEDLIATLKEKIEAHNEKLEAHESAEKILSAEYEDLNSKGEDTEKIERVGEKLLSTIKNIEYHKATAKAYGKIIKML